MSTDSSSNDDLLATLLGAGEKPEIHISPGWAFGIAFASLAVIAKIVTRLAVLRRLYWDDFWALAAWGCFIYATVAVYEMLKAGLMLPEKQWLSLGTAAVMQMMHRFWYTIHIYNFGILAIKLSLLTYFHRLTYVSTSLRRVRQSIWLVTGICVAASIFLFITMFYWCHPIKAFWSFTPFPRLGPHCNDSLQHVSVYVWQGINMASDFYLMIIPHFFLSHFRRTSDVSRWTLRIIFLFLISLGLIIVVAAIIKVYFVATNQKPNEIVLWCYVEGCVALFVACLPTLWLWKSKGRDTERMHQDTDSGRTAEGSSFEKIISHNQKDGAMELDTREV